MGKQEPLAERFARLTVFELAQIRARLEQVTEVIVADIASRQPKTKSDEFIAAIKMETDKKAIKYYRHYCADLGFSVSDDTPKKQGD